MIRTREQTFEQLFYIFKHCNDKPVNPKSAVNTILFLSELPKDIQGACVLLDTEDGSINMIWDTCFALKHRIKHKKVHWVPISTGTGYEKTITIEGTAFGKHQKLIGTTHDFSNGIPKEVIDLLQEITDINSKY
jgi:hypothetical protein